MSFPDFYYGNEMLTFSSWDGLYDYVNTTLNRPMYATPEEFNTWHSAFERYFDSGKIVKHVDNFGGEYYEMPEIITENSSRWLSQGDPISVASPSSSSTSYNTGSGGGGVKAPPKIQSIVTDTTTGAATPGETAKGLKNFGLPTQNQIANVFDGLFKALSIANVAINAQNLGLWRQLCNYVFDADLPPDLTVSDIYNVLFSTTQTVVTRDAQNRIITTVPRSIIERMYDFFKEHITITGDGDEVEVYLPDLIFSLVVWGSAGGNWGERYLKCLTNVAPNTGTVYFDYVKPSDELLQHIVNDFVNCTTGSGFIVPENVAEGLIASMEGVYDHIFNTPQVRSLFTTKDNFKYTEITCYIERGSAPPPKTTPLSLSEFHIQVIVYDVDLHIDTSIEDRQRVETYFPVVSTPQKYLKRGRTGNVDADYGYRATFSPSHSAPEGGYKHATAVITYPSNVQYINVVSYGTTPPGTIANVNGFTDSDTLSDVPAGGYVEMYYNNLGYTGVGVDYEFDEELSTGFVKRTWGVTPAILPHDDTTIDGVFPNWMGKAKTLSQSDLNGNEYQTDYIPVALPHGQENAERVVYEGSVNTPSVYDSQSANQDGVINPNADINDINEEIHYTVYRINDSDYTPEYAPDPIPEGYPNPQYPTNPPAEPTGETDDPTDPTVLPGVTASGMVSVYNPTKSEVISFSSWLWTGNVFENIKKLLQDPMEAIIGMHIMYATPHTTSPSNIIVGWLDSGVAAKVVDKQYTQLDCGSVFVPEYYGDVLDYEPYVHIHLYLPFIGIVSLKPNDVIGKLVNVTYGVDALTGTCLAMVTTTKGDSKIQCYTFPGNCAVQIPLTGGNYANIIRGIASMAVGVAGSVLTGDAIGAVGGVIGGVMSSHLDVSHSGTLGANAGAMGVKKPYLIITRKVAYDAAGYNQFYGYPANKTVVLGACRGYTRVKSVHIESIPIATSDEKQMIETLLKQGVIIR